MPGHERRLVAGEKRQGADQILRHLDALDRLQASDGGELLVHGGKTRARLSHRCSRPAGRWRSIRLRSFRSARPGYYLLYGPCSGASQHRAMTSARGGCASGDPIDDNVGEARWTDNNAGDGA